MVFQRNVSEFCVRWILPRPTEANADSDAASTRSSPLYLGVRYQRTHYRPIVIGLIPVYKYARIHKVQQ